MIFTWKLYASNYIGEGYPAFYSLRYLNSEFKTDGELLNMNDSQNEELSDSMSFSVDWTGLAD